MFGRDKGSMRRPCEALRGAGTMTSERLYCWLEKMEKSEDMSRALDLVFKAHEGQVDKGGTDYVEHVLRVMYRVRFMDEDVMLVGLMHDVIEDTDYTADDLLGMGFSERVVEGILSVTRHAYGEETYAEFVKRAKANDLGREVKIADVTENMDTSRLGELTDKDYSRLRRYRKALEELNAV